MLHEQTDRSGDRAGPVTVVVLAAGLGARMRSRLPKVFHPIMGEPILGRILKTVQGLRPARLIAVASEEMMTFLSSLEIAGLRIAVQEEPLGTGHAASCALRELEGYEGPILIVCGDTPLVSLELLDRLLTRHREDSSLLTIVTTRVDQPFGYGRVVRDERGEICQIVEEKECTPDNSVIQEINAGLYCVEASFLRQLLKEIRRENRQREFYLTDIVSISRRQGQKPGSVTAEDPLEVLGINTREELAKMEKELRFRINREWMLNGVTLEDPDTTYIEPEVKIGSDTRIGPNTHLKGKTRIGTGCRIDGTAYLTDADIGDGVWIHFGVVISQSRLDRGVEVGPFAHLRPGTRLEEKVKVGNFVEVKNSTLGSKTKANHLSYLGDATVGSETNIGAGTITCNFDGFQKHPTVIGSRVQVGSDVQLVAPVAVGDDAYIAAGSTITKRVSPGALALSRTPQVEKKGWVEKKRAGEKRAKQRASEDSHG